MLLTVNDAAQRLGCSAQTIRNMIRAGRLPATRRLGAPRGAWQISSTAVAAFAEETAADEAPPGAAAVA